MNHTHHDPFQDRARDLFAQFELVQTPPEIDLNRMRLGRLQPVRAEMQRQDVGALILIDLINIRYATDARNMTNFTMRTPARTLFLPVAGPVVMFEFYGGEHLAQNLPTIDEVRPGTTVSFATGAYSVYEKAKAWAAELHDLISHHCGKTRIGIERIHFAAVETLKAFGYEIIDAQAVLDIARSVKLPDEIACMRHSLATVDLGRPGRFCDNLARFTRERNLPGLHSYSRDLMTFLLQ